MTRLLSRMKLLLVPSGRIPRRIKCGAFRGLTMDVDLAHQTQLLLGLFERELYTWLRKLSTNINTAIDIGAGEGEYTLYFLAKTQAKKVFAFEPSVTHRTHLMTNLALNNLAHDSRLVVSSQFVGSLDDENECTLDSLVPSISPPCLIKVDVDGGEVNILRGASRVLDLPEIYWIIESHSQQLEEQCIQTLD